MVMTACAQAPTTDSTEQEINGPSFAANAWQLERGVKLFNGGCTATRISDRFAISALHCNTNSGTSVHMYSTGPSMDNSLSAHVERVIKRSGTDPTSCHDDVDCWDSTGLWADLELIELSNTASGKDSLLAGPAATLAWRYPGDGVWGTKVGAGGHEGNPNPTGILRQVDDTTDSGDDNDGWFNTEHGYVDPGDSGGPFYVNGKIVGTLTGTDGGLNYGEGLHTSVPKHLDWILTNIGYRWPGSPAQQSVAYSGTTLEAFITTEQVCQYACEKTAACEGYNFYQPQNICSLLDDITSTATLANNRAALHYGQQIGRSGDVAGYVRNDGTSAVVHRATNGRVHELALGGSGWVPSELVPGAPLVAAGGKLSGYRRADGVDAIVYRSSGNRLIELFRVNGVWSSGDLTNFGGALPAGDPVGYVRADGVSAVVYRSSNGHVNEFALTTNGWKPTDLMTASGTANIASSDPSVYVRSDGFSSVVFRANQAILELFKKPGGTWTIGGPSSIAGAPAAATTGANKPFGYTHHDGTNAIVYRSATNRIIELFLDGAGWHFGDITGNGGAAQGSPVAYVRTEGVESVVYRNTSNQIQELTNTPWQAWNLTSQWSGATATTDPSTYIRKDGFNIVLHGAASNHAGELAHKIGGLWSYGDLTASAGETP